jgi:hypothetical protein
MPGESSTTSLRSANSPVFIKKYDKHANCLSTRSCPQLSCWCKNWTMPYTYSRVHADTRTCTSARARASRAPFAPAREPCESPSRYSHLFVKLPAISTVYNRGGGSSFLVVRPFTRIVGMAKRAKFFSHTH